MMYELIGWAMVLSYAAIMLMIGGALLLALFRFVRTRIENIGDGLRVQSAAFHIDRPVQADLNQQHAA